MKKSILLFSFIPVISTFAALDMTQDRPFTTDIAPPTSQIYYKAGNPTRDCPGCRGINNWARCNSKRLKINNDPRCPQCNGIITKE